MSKRFSPLLGVATFFCFSAWLAQAIQAADFSVASRDDVLVLTSKIQATQFLTHATFGPTQAEVDQLALEMRQQGTIAAATAWIDRQMNEALTPISLHEPLMESMIVGDFPLWTMHTRTGLGTTENPYIYTPNGNQPELRYTMSRTRYRQHAWWHLAIAGQDQLRQKTAWALAQIIAVGRSVATFDDAANEGTITGSVLKPRYFGITNFYDIFVQNAFGKYRDIVGKVTYHGIMGDWLTYRGNLRAQGLLEPDENYAREVMQLFTVGLDLLTDDGVQQFNGGTLIPTYDNDDIRQYAKVFTGLGYGSGTYAPTNTALNPYSPFTGAVSTDPNGTVKFRVPMRMAPSQHDRTTKVLLGHTITNALGNNATHNEISANKEIDDALDGLVNHQSCPPFIANRLIQRMVKSNPSRAYIGRVVAAFKGSGPAERGDLKKVVKAILLDPEAWQPIRVQYQRAPVNKFIVTTMGTEDSRLQEPVLNYTRFTRFFKGNGLYEKAVNASFTTPVVLANQFRLDTRDVEFDQNPYEPPSVFNFYLANHQPPALNGFVASSRIPSNLLVAPEFEIQNALTANRTANFFRSRISAANISQTFQTLNVTTPTSSTRVGTGTIFTIANESTRCRVLYDFTSERDLSDSAGEVTALLERLDMYLCGGTLSSQMKATLDLAVRDQITLALADGSVSTAEALDIAKGVILSIVSCPSFLVTE
ncbi:MAG: DUF1800 family protein [Pirellulaceae bacterium]|nr:DUF1800 family protein [Pirellulaceae bacterium]